MPPIVTGIDEESFCIVWIFSGWIGHDTQSVAPEQLAGIPEPIDMTEERCQVARCRDPAAVRIHSGDVHPVRVAPGLIVVFDFPGRAISQGISGDLHVAYAATPEHVVPNVSLVRDTGQLFDDASKYAVAEIGVREGRSWGTQQRYMLQCPRNELSMIHVRI